MIDAQIDTIILEAQRELEEHYLTEAAKHVAFRRFRQRIDEMELPMVEYHDALTRLARCLGL